MVVDRRVAAQLEELAQGRLADLGRRHVGEAAPGQLHGDQGIGVAIGLDRETRIRGGKALVACALDVTAPGEQVRIDVFKSAIARHMFEDIEVHDRSDQSPRLRPEHPSMVIA